MNASLHTRLSGAPPRGTAYCVDCYADGGKVTVATRMFGDDDLCERHYIKLCKEMGVEPEPLPATAPAEIGQPTPIKKIRQAPAPRRKSVAVRVASDVSRPESTEARGGNHSAAVTTESFPSDSDLAEAARSLPSQPVKPSVAPAGPQGEGIAAASTRSAAANKASAQAEKRVSGNAPARRSTSGRPPLVADDPSGTCAAGTERQHSGSADSSDLSTDVISALGAQGYKLRDAQNAVQQSYKPGDTFDQAFKKAFAIVFAARSAGRPVAVSSSSQRPDSSVAPAAERAEDRAHIPDSAVAARSRSAAHPQPSKPERSKPMAKVCGAPGCGKKLQDRNQSGYCTKHFSLSRYSGGEPGRVCSVRGCETKLRRDNSTGVCRPHSKGATPSARKTQPRAAAPHNPSQPMALHATAPVGIANGNGHGKIAADGAYLVPCQVSEWAMDRIWLKLSPEEKAQLLFGRHDPSPQEKPAPWEGVPAHA